MKNICSFQWVGCPCVKDVAMAYFPQYVYVRTAVAVFRSKIASSTVLLEELLAVGYDDKDKHLTTPQMIVLVRHWGMPEDLKAFRDNWK